MGTNVVTHSYMFSMSLFVSLDKQTHCFHHFYSSTGCIGYLLAFQDIKCFSCFLNVVKRT